MGTYRDAAILPPARNSALRLAKASPSCLAIGTPFGAMVGMC